MPRYLDPTTDFGFKRLFGREESKEVLKGFLFDILALPHPIADLTYLTAEQLPASPAERIGIYDIYCTDTSGSRFIVEMQRSPFRYFKERALFYATFPIIQQIKKGTTYDFQLLPVYCISVLRYQMDEEPGWMRRIQLANLETCKVFYEGLMFVFLELPKFTLPLQAVATPTEKWLYLLKHLPELETVPSSLATEPFPQAFQIAELAAMTPKEREVYDETLKRVSDEQLILESHFEKGREEGFEKGLEKGLEEGLEKGREEEKRANARSMLAEGIAPMTVARVTGLPVDEVEALRTTGE
ncbi:MAG: Rpn family recombination-promoting nuclease/putative transposase [Chloroflexaceae bacterium]|nr:Rpn family recombination-promoting nuclease/putative transposase [Chloroflexaceae bacterium]